MSEPFPPDARENNGRTRYEAERDAALSAAGPTADELTATLAMWPEWDRLGYFVQVGWMDKAEREPS